MSVDNRLQQRKLGVVNEQGDYFESLEEMLAWEAEVAAQLAQGEADIAAGRVYRQEEAWQKIKKALKGNYEL